MTSEPATDEQPAQSAPEADGAGSRRFARLVIEIAIAVAVALLVRGLVAETFYVPSGSMEPTVLPGDRVVVDKWHGADGLQRGDIVVFDGTEVFGGPSREAYQAPGTIGRILGAVSGAIGIDSGEKDYLKRVIGMPGDRVVCCGPGGAITVNGTPLAEPYLADGMAPSELTFNLEVPAGKVFVLGDNRSASSDSRAHLGDPGGGMVPISDIIGEPVLRYWPFGRWGTIDSGAAPASPSTK